ncbi:transcriptional Coactivator p15-domain-containing protein [Dipodascopsis uninucleata]
MAPYKRYGGAGYKRNRDQADVGEGSASRENPAVQSILQIDLGKRKRLTVQSFKNTPLIDIREFYTKENAEGLETWLPGKKGISLTVESWRALVSNFDKIDRAIKELSGLAIEDEDASDTRRAREESVDEKTIKKTSEDTIAATETTNAKKSIEKKVEEEEDVSEEED